MSDIWFVIATILVPTVLLLAARRRPDRPTPPTKAQRERRERAARRCRRRLERAPYLAAKREIDAMFARAISEFRSRAAETDQRK